MKYYILQLDNPDNIEKYGYVPDEVITDEEQREHLAQTAFRVVDQLPLYTKDLDGKEFYIDYEAENDTFVWKTYPEENI